MSREILSTARPTKLRLAGFLCIAVGAVTAGYGATAEWATIGFPEDVQRELTLSVHGTDFWEGKVVLLSATVALIAMLALRLSRSDGTRVSIAVGMIAIGIACMAIPVLDAARARDRFGDESGVNLYAPALAAQLGQPEDVVRELFEEQFQRALSVDVERGIWISAAGGILLVIGGALSFVWVRRRNAGRLGADHPVREAGAP